MKMAQTVIQSMAQSISRCCNIVCLTLLIATGLPISPIMASPLEALRNSDMRAMIQEVIAIYEDHDISWASYIDWEIQSYKNVYWYYSHGEKKIVVGDLPSKDQIGDFWQNWSEALTDGNWDPSSFFKSAEDAYDMALFNQFVLTIHESAHAVTYRYDPDHRKRHDYEINCREFYADHLTAAILQHTARQQPELDRMRKRYLDLVRSMHSAIPSEYLVASADYSDLVEDCAIIAVEQPTPDSLQAYASAYFTRWEALLVSELPGLEDMFVTHLKSHLQQRFKWVEQAAEWKDGQLLTLRSVDHIADRILNAGRILDGGKRATAFAPDGTLWIAEARFDSKTLELEYVYQRAEGTPVPSTYSLLWPRDSTHITLKSIAAFGMDRFFATFQEAPSRTNLIQFDLHNGVWVPRILAEWENTSKAFVFRTADNRVFSGVTNFFDSATEKTVKSYWAVKEFDLMTGEILGSHDIPVETNQALAIDGSGRLYLDAHNQIFHVDQLANIKRIAGIGLEGARDGQVSKAELGWVQALQFFPDGSALMLNDSLDDPDMQMIRKLVPSPHP